MQIFLTHEFALYNVYFTDYRIQGHYPSQSYSYTPVIENWNLKLKRKFAIAAKIKYLDIYLTKSEHYLSDEHCTPVKGVNIDLNKETAILYSRMERPSVLKVFILHNFLSRFNAIPADFFYVVPLSA